MKKSENIKRIKTIEEDYKDEEISCSSIFGDDLYWSIIDIDDVGRRSIMYYASTHRNCVLEIWIKKVNGKIDLMYASGSICEDATPAEVAEIMSLVWSDATSKLAKVGAQAESVEEGLTE